MAFEELKADVEATEANAGKKWIRPMKLGSGWAAVMLWINNEEKFDDGEKMGPFVEPYDTGIGRYVSKSDAANEAWEWAETEGLPVFMDGCMKVT